LACLCVDPAGDPIIVVVVADETIVFVLPGVNVDVVWSAQLAWILILAVVVVTILIMSDVDVSNIC
jgi:hypothetical protein